MAEEWVVDSSVLIKIFLEDEEHSDRAKLLINRYVSGAADLTAPELALYEVLAGLHRAVEQGKARASLLDVALDGFERLDFPTFGGRGATLGLGRAASGLARQYGCRFTEAIYLALAEALGFRFVTADRRLAALAGQLEYITWIGDYEPESP